MTEGEALRMTEGEALRMTEGEALRMAGENAQDDRGESLRIQGNVLRIQRWGAEDDKKRGCCK